MKIKYVVLFMLTFNSAHSDDGQCKDKNQYSATLERQNLQSKSKKDRLATLKDQLDTISNFHDLSCFEYAAEIHVQSEPDEYTKWERIVAQKNDKLEREIEQRAFSAGATRQTAQDIAQAARNGHINDYLTPGGLTFLTETINCTEPFFHSCDTIELMKILIENGASVNQSEGVTDRTPLMLAAEKGNIEAAQLLLDNGAKASTRVYAHEGEKGIPSQYSALDIAQEKGDYKMARLLQNAIKKGL